MDAVVERCAGLDVHRDNVVATVRVPSEDRRRFKLSTRTFRATIAGLTELREWLAAFGVTLVGMEATGVYWKPVFQVLEDRFECWLLNAQHLRNVPGRKTDVKDSEWICQLVAHGLVRPSFVPPPEIRRLRDLTRFRKAQINERTRAIQRLEKVLQDAGIKLTSVASGAWSKSARAMLEALLSGVSDPEQLAELAKGRMRAKIPQLREALQSRFKIDHHGILVAQLIAHIDTLDHAIAMLDEKIEEMLAPHAKIVELLCTIPGVALRTAQVLIAECGLDMSRFPTAAHLASWAGICPGAQRVRRTPTLGTNPPRSEVADRGADRVGQVRRPHQGHLLRRSLRAATRTPRRAQGDRRHPPRHPDRLLLHRSRPSPVPRTRARLATPPLLPRTPRPPAPATARSARLQGHPRASQPRRAGGFRSRLTCRQPQPGYRHRLGGANACCPNVSRDPRDSQISARVVIQARTIAPDDKR
jgi:transposase